MALLYVDSLNVTRVLVPMQQAVRGGAATVGDVSPW
jgi:hypothetical protein